MEGRPTRPEKPAFEAGGGGAAVQVKANIVRLEKNGPRERNSSSPRLSPSSLVSSQPGNTPFVKKLLSLMNLLTSGSLYSMEAAISASAWHDSQRSKAFCRRTIYHPKFGCLMRGSWQTPQRRNSPATQRGCH